MRQFSFLAITALILAGFGISWIASTSQARVAASTNGVSINHDACDDGRAQFTNTAHCRLLPDLLNEWPSKFPQEKTGV